MGSQRSKRLPFARRPLLTEVLLRKPCQVSEDPTVEVYMGIDGRTLEKQPDIGGQHLLFGLGEARDQSPSRFVGAADVGQTFLAFGDQKCSSFLEALSESWFRSS